VTLPEHANSTAWLFESIVYETVPSKWYRAVAADRPERAQVAGVEEERGLTVRTADDIACRRV
jgi:hypothetical protein